MLILFQVKKIPVEFTIIFQIIKKYRWNLHEKKSKKIAIGGIYMRP